jgi:predicted transcriptional regulator
MSKAKRRCDASGSVISAATANGYGGDPEIINQYRRAIEQERRYAQALIAELDHAIRERADLIRGRLRMAKLLHDLVLKTGAAEIEPEANEMLTLAQEAVQSLDRRGLSMALQRVRNGVKRHEVDESRREVAANDDQRDHHDLDGDPRSGAVDARR